MTKPISPPVSSTSRPSLLNCLYEAFVKFGYAPALATDCAREHADYHPGVMQLRYLKSRLTTTGPHSQKDASPRPHRRVSVIHANSGAHDAGLSKRLARKHQAKHSAPPPLPKPKRKPQRSAASRTISETQKETRAHIHTYLRSSSEPKTMRDIVGYISNKLPNVSENGVRSALQVLKQAREAVQIGKRSQTLYKVGEAGA